VLVDFNLKDILDLGGQGVLLFLLWQVWQRLNTVTDILIEDRRRAEAQRFAIMENQGINPHDSGIYKRKDLGLPSSE
jgi:hypothetical protein